MKLKRMLITGLTALTLFAQTLSVTPVTVYADEAEGVMNEAPPEGAEGEAAEGEAVEGEMAEGEMAEGGEEQSSSGVVVSSIEADNGLYIASTFPESEMPSGFTANTVNYQGQDIMLAQMVTKSTSIGTEGMTVTLAYLTDEGGNGGEFYLCDVTENAKMSDMIKIDGADGRYIIVLDPGDNITGPDGFVKHNLSWGSKSAVAWSLPAYSTDEEEKEEKDDKKDEEEAKDSDASLGLFSEKVYAADLFAAGAGSGEDEEKAGGDEEASEQSGAEAAEEAAKKAMNDYIEESNIAHTNASGLIEAQPDDFCLLYAVDEEGNVGFYLYDIAQKIYQRYVDIPKGEGATLAKYRKQSRIRLIIIIVLALALLVVIFALINTLTKSRDRDTYPMPQRRFRDEDEDISDLKSRMDRSRRPSVRNEDDYRRSRRSSLADEEDMDDGFDMDDEPYGSSRNMDERSYRGRQEFTTRYPSGSQQPPQRRGSASAPAPRGRMGSDEDMRREAPGSRGRMGADDDMRREPPRGRMSADEDMRREAPRGRMSADDDMRREAPRGRMSADDDMRRDPRRGAQPQRPSRGQGAPSRGRARDDFDDDFEFEYLKFHK